VDFLTLALDDIDRKILTLLQRDSSLPMAELAEKAGLSSSPCWRRVRRLKEEGVIQGEVTLLDRKRLGLNVVVIANISLSHQDESGREEFERFVQSSDQVLECMSLSGEHDYLIRIVTQTIADYDAFLKNKLLRVSSVQSVNSSIVLDEIKRTTTLPIS
jgi:Lrp/AsnC family transcriptional regulator